MNNIKDFVRGQGPEIETGYRRGDSWVATSGPHANCGGKIFVIGPGIGRDSQNRIGDGVLLRCSGCFGSSVLR